MNLFTCEELRVLKERYRLTTQTKHSALSIQAVDLLDEQQLDFYLIQVKEITKAANSMVAASLFVKRYSFAVLIALYAMSALNKRMDFSFENISIETFDKSDMRWNPFFKFHNLSLKEVPEQHRMNWRNELLKQIFFGHIDVLFTHLSKRCKLSKLIMWESLYNYIQWMYQDLLNDSLMNSNYQAISDDLDYIVEEGAGSLFGLYRQNPFLKYHNQKREIKKFDRLVHKRKTCCFSYLAGDQGRYCSVCPIVCDAKQVYFF